MATLKHPTLADVTVEVDDSRAAEWLEAGWKTEPEAAEPEPTKPRRAAATKE